MQTSKSFIIVAILLLATLLFAFAFSVVKINTLSVELEQLKNRPPTHPQPPQIKSDLAPLQDPRYDELNEWCLKLSIDIDSLNDEISKLKAIVAAEKNPPPAESANPPSATSPAAPHDLTDLQAKIEQLQQTLSEVQKGPSYLTSADRLTLKAELENIIAEKEKKETEQQYNQLRNRILDSMTEELSLTDFQKEKVTEIVNQRFKETAQLRDAFQSGKLNAQDRSDLWNQIATKTDDEMAKVLDVQQMEKYNKWKSDRSWWISPRPQQGRR